MPGRDLAGSVEGGSGQTIEPVTANAPAVSPSASERAARKLKASWRARNPGYATGHRLTHRNQDDAVQPLRTPPPLSPLPWDLAKDQFRAHLVDRQRLFRNTSRNAGKDPIRPRAY